MLDKMLTFLMNLVNDYLSTSSGWGAQATEHGQVVFGTSDSLDNPDFKLDALTLILVNVEEEHSLRPADPYRRALSDGTMLKVLPPVHLNASILFVARFKDYSQGLHYLSLVLQFFLKYRVLDHQNSPALDAGIEKLSLELVSLPFSEQNYLWSILRSTYQPSLLYKVRMAVYRDENGFVIPPPTEQLVRVAP
jgi:hypothetical protein